jgi:hypothetical protein
MMQTHSTYPTHANAPESIIQLEQDVPFNVGDWFEISSSVCERFTKFPRTAVFRFSLEFQLFFLWMNFNSSSSVSICLSPWATFSQVASQFFDFPQLPNLLKNTNEEAISFLYALLNLLLQITWATVVNNQVQYLRLNPRPYSSVPRSLPVYCTTTQNPNCSSAEVQPTPSCTFWWLLLLDPSGFFSWLHIHSRPPPPKPQFFPLCPLLVHTASSNHLCSEQWQLPCFSLLLPCTASHKPQAVAPFTTTTAADSLYTCAPPAPHLYSSSKHSTRLPICSNGPGVRRALSHTTESPPATTRTKRPFLSPPARSTTALIPCCFFGEIFRWIDPFGPPHPIIYIAQLRLTTSFIY